MALLYTKFQLNRTKTVGGVTRKRKSLQTDGRTHAEGYNIIQPFFKRAYKNRSYITVFTSNSATVNLNFIMQWLRNKSVIKISGNKQEKK